MPGLTWRDIGHQALCPMSYGPQLTDLLTGVAVYRLPLSAQGRGRRSKTSKGPAAAIAQLSLSVSKSFIIIINPTVDPGSGTGGMHNIPGVPVPNHVVSVCRVCRIAIRVTYFRVTKGREV